MNKLLLGLCCLVLLPSSLWAAEPLVSILEDTPTVAAPEPTPDPVPDAPRCLPACTYTMCIMDCYGQRTVTVHCQENELTCWVDDPCMGVCWETERIPELCNNAICRCCSTCRCLSLSAQPSCSSCGPVSVPTVAPVPTYRIIQPPQNCPGGVCPVPASTGNFRGGAINNGSGRVESNRVFMLGAINIHRDNTSRTEDRRIFNGRFRFAGEYDPTTTTTQTNTSGGKGLFGRR